MTQIVMIHDLVDPDDPQGRSYRQVNAEKKHGIPVGALVELVHENDGDEFLDEEDYRGVRLYVVYHARDCDQTPLYCLAANRHNIIKERPNLYNFNWVCGWPEESLKVIKLPKGDG